MDNKKQGHDEEPLSISRPFKRRALSFNAPDFSSDPDARRRLKEAQNMYGRGKRVATKSIKDKKLRANLSALETKYQDATVKARDAEILLENRCGYLEPDGELERTYKVRQLELKQEVAIETARKGFELKLEGLGPYKAEYSRNGRHLLLFGRKGHVASTDWREGKIGFELQLGETVRDGKWLHNSQYVAIAQKKYVYIYDHDGVELHCLRKLNEVSHVEFLPYHFLLATVGKAGHLIYTDTSTGQQVSDFATRLGSPTAFAQNPHNAILHLGHHNGTVTLWSPNSSSPLVKLLPHRGPVRSIAIDREGRYMVSAGQDLKMAVWDLRMFKEVNRYFVRQPGSSLAVSDRNITAIGWGTQVSIWKDLFLRDSVVQEKVQSPYMAWGGDGKRIERVRWCPFEDVLGVSHDRGFSSILVPGAGEPNFDALELNPYENTKQRQEAEVKALLNKLQPEMISLDPDFIGNIDLATTQQRKLEADEKKRPEDTAGKSKKSSHKKGNKNVIDAKRLWIEQKSKERQEQNRQRMKQKQEELGPALARFARKSRE